MNVIKQIVKDGEYGTQTIKMIVKDNERGAQGEKGDKGDSATITAGNAYSIPYTEAPAVMNTGTSSDAVFDFYIPKGERGAQGPQGDKGDRGPAGPEGPAGRDGTAATIAVGTTSTLQPGDDATVTNTGTSANAVFNFGIPKGEKGDDGRDGAIQYTAGTGISISDENVISATGGGGSSTWGSITGTLSDQTDLQNALNAKQNTLTAGDGITIASDTISADIKPADFFTSTTDAKSGTGTSVTLTDVTTAPFVSITPKGDTSQQTYTGKNLLKTQQRSSSSNGITATINSDGSIHVTGTATATWADLTQSITPGFNYPAGTQLTFSMSQSVPVEISVFFGGWVRVSAGNTSGTDTTTASTSNMYISSSGYTVNQAYDFTIKNPMLEVGSSPTTFEPYVGGIAAPNPEYPQDVKVVTGEQTVEVHTDNLLNINFTNTTRNGLTYTNNGDGTITISGTTNGTSDGFNISPYSSSKPLVLKKNTYYTQRVEVVSGSQGPIAVVPSFKNSSGTIVWNYFSNNGGRVTEDVMKNNNYNVYWQGTGQQVNVTLRIWLVEGYNLEAPFVPYQSQKYEVNLGKNLFNTVDRTQNRMSMDCGTTNNRVTVNGTPTRNNFGGSYWNLNGTDNASANYYNYDNTTSGTTLPAGTYTLSIHNISGSYTSPSSVQLFATKVYSGSTPIPTLATITLTNNQTSATFTLAEKTTVKIQFRVAVSSDTGVAVPVFNNYSFDLQLEKGSKVTPYAPFMSKNLLDPAKMVDGYVGSDGTIVQSSGSGDMATPYFIPVAPNSTLTFTIYKTTGTNAPWFGMCEYSSANESSFITRQVEQTAGITSATFTVGSTTKYVRVSARNMNVATEYQLEIGNTSTAYEPYSIELCKIGDYQDYFYKGSDGWYFHKIFGKLVVWPKQISNYNNHSGSNYITINYNYRLVQKLSTIEVTTASNRFVGATITQTWQGSVINGVSQPTNGTYLQFSLSASAGSSLAEVQSYFESRETEAYFLLENPIDIKIVNTNLISQLEALANANSYSDTTHIDTASDGYNLPMILTTEVFTNTLVAITEVIDGKQNKLTAGSNITITNNTISATDTTYSTMTGASAGSAGASGLVPAPSAGDQDKVLKGDGTWGTVTTGTINDATLTIQQNGAQVATFTANSATNATANITTPVITVTDTDPGEGSALSANNFVAVYGGNVYNPDYSTSEALAGFTWIDGSPVYKKTINVGSLPDTSTKNVPHGITNLNRVIKVDGYAYRSADDITFLLPYAAGATSAISVGIAGANLQIGTGMDRTNVQECYVTLYYTKSA